MVKIIVVFPKQQDAVNIRNLLMRNGHEVAAVCTSGGSVIQAIDQMEGTDGIIVSGFKLADMTYSDLLQMIPDTYDMMVMTSRTNLDRIYEYNVVKVPMPVKAYDLFTMLRAMENTLLRKREKRKAKPKGRTSEEKALIENAKGILMETKNMSEYEAHRYIQKCSMDNGTNMVETAQMILDIYSE